MNPINQSPLQQNQITAAIEKYTQMLAQNPEAPEIYFNLGNLYAQKEQWQKAISHYKKTVKIEPKFANAYRNLAKVHLKIGDEIKAANFWYKAIKVEPNSDRIKQYLGLGNTFQTQKKFNKAADCYQRAIEIQPDLLPAYHALAKVFNAQGKYQKIIFTYRQGAKKNPQNPKFHLALAQALASQEKWEKASNRFRSALNLDGNLAVGYYHWGYVLSQMDQWQQAEECHNKAIQLKPEYWEAYYQLGLVFQHLEKWEQARDCHEKVTQLNREFVSGYLQLGLVYQKLEQYELAIKYCNQALLIAPESSPLEEQAIALYQKNLDDHPELTAILYYEFAKLLRKKSRFQYAIAAYQKTIEINPEFRLAHIHIQYTFISPKQLPQHIKFYRKVVAENPKLAIAWGNLADALTEQNQIEEAITCYRKSSYQEVINTYPQLVELNWKEKKESALDFIIIGSEKCGTSSLYKYLSHHPQILFPHKKELDFFWRKYDYGIDWYLAHFPTISDREDFLTGEATPNYIRSSIAAQRIKKHFPNTKLILLLRNPIDRAISWHYHKLNHGQLKEDLETAILTEIKNLESFTEEEIINSGYFEFDSVISSLYIYKVKSWLKIFEREQMLILKSEDFYNDPAKNMEKVYNFLGLPNHSLAKYHKINSGSYNPANEKIKNILRDYFEPYNRQLEDYLGMEFNWN